MSNNTEITIAPGTYQLVRDIANPDVDRRFTRDWTKEPVFKAGTKYLVQAYSTVTMTKAADGVDASLVSYAITQIGARQMHRIYTHSEVGQLLVAAFIRIEESFDAQAPFQRARRIASCCVCGMAWTARGLTSHQI